MDYEEGRIYSNYHCESTHNIVRFSLEEARRLRQQRSSSFSTSRSSLAVGLLRLPLTFQENTTLEEQH